MERRAARMKTLRPLGAFALCAAAAFALAAAFPLEAGRKAPRAVRQGVLERSGARPRARGAPVLVQASSKKMPGWVTRVPEDKEYLGFVGTSGDAESYDRGKKEAIEDAVSQVVRTIGVTVTSKSTYEERYFADQYRTTISSELLTEGRARLQDAEIKEIYFEKYARPDGTLFFRVWALLRYSRKEVAREQERLRSIMQAKYGEVSALEAKAEEHAAARRIAEAIVSHLQAASTALSIEDGGVLFDRNVNRAEELVLRLRFEKAGGDPLGFVGEPLPSPLLVRVTYEDGGKRSPVANFPVLFSYRVPRERSEGYTLIVRSVPSGSDGTAACPIDRVYEVSDANVVEAGPDPEMFIGRLREAPEERQGAVRTLEELLRKKGVVLSFRSDTRARGIPTGLLFLQRDENGAPAGPPEGALAVYDVLFEKKFAVTVLPADPRSFAADCAARCAESARAGKDAGVKRIVCGSLRVVAYETVSGYQVAKVHAEAALCDLETGALVRTWQTQRSGTGGTRELARANAFREAGRALGNLLSTTMP